MYAVSLWQPWADWVVWGVKTIETRSWPAPEKLAGQWLAIHAAKKFDKQAPLTELELSEHRLQYHTKRQGAIVGAAWLERVARLSEADWRRWQRRHCCPLEWWDERKFGWFVAKAITFNTPIPCTGHQRLWVLPAEVEAQVQEGIIRCVN